MFSASFMDINQVSSTAKEKLVDFELFEIGGSLTPHGRSDRFEVYSASVDSEPTHVTISGINGVILEVHYQNFIIDPENIGAWGVGSSVLKDHCPGCGDGQLDIGEECDDRNFIDGDGCSTTCLV